MALERVGLTGKISVDSGGAVDAIKKPRDELGRFVGGENQAKASSDALASSLGSLNAQFKKTGEQIGKAADKAGAIAGSIGSAAKGLGYASAPLTLGIGLGAKQAADFEQQMDAVAAITGSTGAELTALTNKAKAMGATTVFSATQAGEGLELLGRAGFTADESINALAGVMNAAAADSIPLATSADIVANSIRSMNLKATDATDVADVLALASARTNTNMVELGEAFKYASAQAHTMGIDFPTTSAALGVLADAGLKGSSAGTSFTNMLVQLAKPSKLATQYMKTLGGSIYETKDGSLDLQKTLASLGPGLAKVTSKTQKAAMITEIFGIRGQKAVSAISMALESGKFDKLTTELKNEMDGVAGAAERMAKTRLDNFKGQITLLASALEGLSIEVFTPFLENAKTGLKSVTTAIGNVVSVLIELSSSVAVNREEMEKKYGVTAVAVAYGIADAIKMLISTWNAMRDRVVGFFSQFAGQQSPQMIQSITKWIVVLGLVLGAIAPILIGFGTVLTLVSSILPAFAPIGAAIGAAFSPLLIVLAAAAAAFFLLQNEGETAGQTINRIFQLVKKGILYVIDNAIMPFANVFIAVVKPAVMVLWDAIKEFAANAKAQFNALFSGLIQTMERLAPLFRAIFSELGKIIGVFVRGVAGAFAAVFDVVSAVLKPIRQIATFILEVIVNALIRYVGMAVKLAESLGISVHSGFKEFVSGGEFKINADVGVDGAAGIKAATEAAAAAAEATSNVTAQKAEAAKTPEVHANVNIDDKRCVEVSNKVNLDGREQNLAAARHKQEINERAGFKATPWQRRIFLEQGAAPVGGTG